MNDLSKWERNRYARHILLKEVGTNGQKKLLQSSVLCVGAGGLGSPVLQYLAAAGIGRIGIIDDDVVESSNLQRQVIHKSKNEGMPKVQSAKESISELNPQCKIECFQVRLTAENALQTLEDFDLIIDGTDNFPTRYLIDDACAMLGKPFIYGSIFKFEGQVSLFNHNGGPRYRDLFPKPPPPGLVPSCGEAGVLGVLPGVIGSIQATEAVKVLLNIGQTLSGRMLLYNALQMSFSELSIPTPKNRPAVTRLVDYQEFCAGPNGDNTTTETMNNSAINRHRDIGPSETTSKLENGWKPFIVDVRHSFELDISKFPNTDLAMAYGDLINNLDALPENGDLLFVCRIGTRSSALATIIVQTGRSGVYSLDGGLNAWAVEIDPSMPTY